MSEKIIFYNDYNIHNLFVKISGEKYLPEKIKLENLIGLKDVGRLLSISGPINRNSEYFPFNFAYTKIPKDFNTTKSFDDVCLKVGQDVWKSAGHKKVALFWSGGIDSTTALVSLILTNDNWINDLIIYTSKYAIEVEYPFFHNTFLKKANIIFLKDDDFYEPKLYDEDRFVVDGCCGDQIWGCNVLKKMNDMRQQPYKKLFDSNFFNVSLKTTTKKYIERQIEIFPVPIKTISDLYWFLTFTHKWDHVRYRHMSGVSDIKLFDRMNSFFNHDDFQKWAMSNMDKKVGDTWNTYKQPAKDFIFSFTNDQDYRINKLQHESMGHSIKNSVKRYNHTLITTNIYNTNLYTGLKECLKNENSLV